MNSAIRGSHPKFRQIPPEALETISDVFLASAGRDGDHPAYNEDQLRKKRQRAVRAEEYFGMMSVVEHSAPAPEDSILAEDERAVWRLYQEGYRASEIARLLHVTRPTAVRLLRSAARRISSHQTKFSGIGEIHYREVHKRVYRKPSHCFEQPCRRLGYCKYALKGQMEEAG